MNRLVVVGAVIMAMTPVAEAQVGTPTHFPSIGPERARLEIKAATDISALAPLILDFQNIAPGIAVDYVEFLTNDLAREADLACNEVRPFGDILISSAVDHMVKYANDGCAVPHVSEETQAIPNTSTVWRDEVFGFTFEPAVIVYNTQFVSEEDVPRSRRDLADLLRRKQHYFLEKIITYDLRLSGLGYLLAFQDAQQNSTTYGRLLESMGGVNAQHSCCTSAMLSNLVSGEAYIGYNLLGSYAQVAAQRNPALRIVLPRDYTLILHRAALIPQHAANPALGAQFLDYLLSERGQDIAIQSSFFFSRDGEVPDNVDGPTTLMTSGIGRTITIRPTLLVTQDEAQRTRFINEWLEVIEQPLSAIPQHLP